MAAIECFKCKGKFELSEMITHEGRNLCEDCYMTIMTMPKTCDPWAVYAAKNSKKTEISEIQNSILKLLKDNPPIEINTICSKLAISEEEFKRNFATLRHMELARGTKVDGKVCYTTF